MNAGRRTNSPGFVLVSVMWILAILSVIALSFATRAMRDRQMAWYEVDREQALLMARGAVERAVEELRNRDELNAYHGQEGYTGLDQRWARQLNLFREASYFYSELERSDQDFCVYSITDCESRVSLNDAPAGVLRGLGAFNYRTIRRIEERRDPVSGRSQQDRFVDIDEVRDIQSIPWDAWRGDDETAGLRDLLTTWGDADGRINVNTARAEVLRAIPDLDDGIVEAIMAYRAGSDEVLGTRDDLSFPALEEISRRVGVSAEDVAPLLTYGKTESNYFRIEAHATRRQGKINARCTVFVEAQGDEVTVLDWREETRGT